MSQYDDDRPLRPFAPLLLGARELDALRDLVARRLVEIGQPITEPEVTDDVGLLWSLHTCMAEARYTVDALDGEAVTPTGLRRAARVIILDGREGTLTAARHANQEWSDRLIGRFEAHAEELMTLAEQCPPKPAAEIRLLQYCLLEATQPETELIVAATKVDV